MVHGFSPYNYGSINEVIILNATLDLHYGRQMNAQMYALNFSHLNGFQNLRTLRCFDTSRGAEDGVFQHEQLPFKEIAEPFLP